MLDRRAPGLDHGPTSRRGIRRTSHWRASLQLGPLHSRGAVGPGGHEGRSGSAGLICELTAATNAAVAACAGHSGDGTLTTDAFLADPRLCTYDPAQMSCSAQSGNPNCLTSQEVG